MIWLFLINWFSARTGLRVFDFRYTCVRCGYQGNTRVAAEGFGSANFAGSNALAQYLAERNAHQRAYAALSTAQCPACACFHPHFVAEIERRGKKQIRENRLRLPLALIGAALVTALCASAPLLTERPILWLCAAGAGLFIGALVVISYSSPVHVPPWVAPPNVWFWRSATQDWIPATALPLAPGPSAPPAPHAVWKWLGWLGMALGTGAVVFGFLFWWGTRWSKLYVLNPAREPLTIYIDGESMGELQALDPHSWSDPRPEAWEVSPETHVIEVFTQRGGRIQRIELDVSSRTLFIPRTRRREVCVVKRTRTYRGRTRVSDEYELLEREGGVWDLDEIGINSTWEAPPPRGVARLRTQTALRVKMCTEAEELVRASPAPGGGR